MSETRVQVIEEVLRQHGWQWQAPHVRWWLPGTACTCRVGPHWTVLWTGAARAGGVAWRIPTVRVATLRAALEGVTREGEAGGVTPDAHKPPAEGTEGLKTTRQPTPQSTR